MDAFRVGQGYDVHIFCQGRDLMLGGVRIPYARGLHGHSDADVLIHAICDAILGACALRDIGCHFPDNDPRYAGIDSMRLLEHVVDLAAEKGYLIENVDATLVAEEPKLQPHIPAMCQRLTGALKRSGGPGVVNVKATTNEGLGHIGRGEGIAAQAVALLRRPAADMQ